MSGYNTFCTYMAVKLHFTTEGYDFFRYHGKYTRLSPEKFEHRKDRYFFHKMDRLYPLQEELIFFLAANFFSRTTEWVRDLLTEEAKEVYLQRKKVKESLQYMVTQDLDRVGMSRTTFRALIATPNTGTPALLQTALQGEILPETLIVVGAATGCWASWDREITDTIIYPTFRRRCQRYAPFLEIDIPKFRQVLRARLT